MDKSTKLKCEIRFQQWVQQVQEFNSRPADMIVKAWCISKGINTSTFATRLKVV